MRLLVVIVFCLELYLPMDGRIGDARKKDAEMLQGEWQARALQVAGKPLPAKVVEGFTLKVEGERVTISTANAGPRTMTYRINPAAAPRTIDLTLTEGAAKGQVLLGIYSFAEDELKLCLREVPELGSRPKSFDTKNETGTLFVTLKRVKR